MGNYATPVREFMQLILGMYNSLPIIIQSLIGIVMLVTVFYGIMDMIRK